MNTNKGLRNLLQSLNHYLVFFVIIAFVITCCLMLFVSVLQHTLGVAFTEEQISAAAKLTFLNVVGISALLTLLDSIRRRWIVIRPIRRIIQTAEQISAGDFSARVPQVKGILGEDMFNEIGSCINNMAAELATVETLRTDFVANVSHELKTPLAIMQNYATMLQAQNLPEEERIAHAKAVSAACRRLADLITNILRLNKLENRQIHPAAASFDLSEQLCGCLLQFENRWEEKQLYIETDLEEGVMITSDEELLSLVWNNLFSNAMKFTAAGDTVSVSLHTRGEDVRVSVSDTGCGMSPEIGAHIFEKFYQGDTSHATQGNGLGLALVKRVVDILHGEIIVESEQGKGSRFTVILRRKPYEAEKSMD